MNIIQIDDINNSQVFLQILQFSISSILSLAMSWLFQGLLFLFVWLQHYWKIPKLSR